MFSKNYSLVCPKILSCNTEYVVWVIPPASLKISIIIVTEDALVKKGTSGSLQLKGSFRKWQSFVPPAIHTTAFKNRIISQRHLQVDAFS